MLTLICLPNYHIPKVMNKIHVDWLNPLPKDWILSLLITEKWICTISVLLSMENADVLEKVVHLIPIL
jgi:hypothetical protein